MQFWGMWDVVLVTPAALYSHGHDNSDQETL